MKTILKVGIAAGIMVVVGVVLFVTIYGATGGFNKETPQPGAEPLDPDPVPDPDTDPVPSKPLHQYAIWDWQIVPYFTSASNAYDSDNIGQIDLNSERMVFLKSSTVTDIYLQIDTDVPIANLNALVKELNKYNIGVHALDGHTEMIGTKRDRYDTFITYIQSYQSAYSKDGSLNGIHLDVESWGGGGFEPSTNPRIELWQNLMLETQETAHDLGLVFGSDIPAWFNSVEYDNIHGQGALSNWLSEHIDFVVLMAYRNEPEATVDISEEEVLYSSSTTPNTKNTNKIHQNSRYQRSNGFGGIVVGIETIQVDETWGSNPPKSISYHGESFTTVQTALEHISLAFKDDVGFAGVAVHDFSGFLALEE